MCNCIKNAPENQGGSLKISDCLGRGAASAITCRELEQVTGIPGRKIRKLIQGERLQGVPILESSGRNPGYFLPANAEEIRRHYRTELARGRAILKAAGIVKLAELDFPEG